jgi:hypothetical protein
MLRRALHPGWLLVGLAAAGCGDDAPTPDVTFTGGYEDWDYDETFVGVAGATVTLLEDPSVTATTAPNGRSTLLVPGDRASHVGFAADGYLDAVYTVEPAAAALGPYEVRGLRPERLATLLADELATTHGAGRALLQVEVRSYPGLAAVAGVGVAVEGGGAAFHRGADFTWAPGEVSAGGGYVLWVDVPVPDDGEAALTVTAPAGVTCVAPPTLRLVADGLAMTTVACGE